MAEVASAYVSLLPSARNWSSSVEQQVAPQLKKSGSRLGGFLGASLKAGAVGVAAGAGAAIGTALFSGFKRLNAIDQAKAKLTGLGHSAQGVDKIMTNALASVKGTAFGLDEAATTAASVVAAGIKPGRQLQGVLKTVADTATIAGTSMADMGQVFGSVAARGKLQGDDLLQLQSRGVPVLAFLAKHYHTTAKAASEMVSAGDVDFKNFAAAMKENLGGAALDSGKTFSGAFANLKASLSRIGANLLSGLFPQIQKGMVKLTGILGQIEPVASKVGAAVGKGLAQIGPVVGDLAKRFGPSIKQAFGQVGPIVAQVGQSLSTNLLPLLRTMGQTFTTQILPAVTSFVTFVASRLGPVLAQAGQIIATQVVPILAKFGQFIYGTLVPAIVAIAANIGQKLKPVFDQLVATFRTQVLPTLQKLLVKFKEWQPTIQQVILIVAKVIGKVLEFAAAILGKVLPVAIRFAGWLLSKLVPAVANVIEIVARVIGKVIEFGVTLFNAGKKVAKFVTKAINEVGKLPGKIGGVFKDVGTWLLDAGKKLIGGLIDGIKDKFNDVKNTLGSLGKKAVSWKGPPAKDKVLLRGNGRLLIDGLIDGLADRFPAVKSTLTRLTKLIADGIKAGGPAATKAAKDAAAKLKKAHDAALAQSLKVAKTKADFRGYISKTLLPGLSGDADKVASTVQGLASKIRSAMLALAGPDKRKQRAAVASAAAYMRSIKKQTAALVQNAKDRAKAADALKAAQEKLADAIQVRDDFIKQVSDQAESWASIINAPFDDDNPVTGKGIVSFLADRLKAIKDFAANVSALLAKGLNKTTYQQLVEAGPEQGARFAQALLNAPETISAVNDLTAQIGSAADALGKSAGTTLFQAGVDTAQQFADGLQVKLDALTAAGSKMAQAVVAGIRAELGLGGVKVKGAGGKRSPQIGTAASAVRIDNVVHVYLDGKEVHASVVKTNQQTTRQTGQNPMVA